LRHKFIIIFYQNFTPNQGCPGPEVFLFGSGSAISGPAPDPDSRFLGGPGTRAFSVIFFTIFRNPKLEIQNLKSKTRNPELEIQNSKSKTQNPKLEIQNSKSKTRNPKLEIQNSKSKTRNPKLEIQNSKSKTQNPKLLELIFFPEICFTKISLKKRHHSYSKYITICGVQLQ